MNLFGGTAVEASKGTPEPMLLHPQPSEHDVSDEVVRQQIMDGLTLSSEDSGRRGDKGA